MRAFVSYNAEDGEFVRRLIKDLIRAGVDIDIDQRSFVPGRGWGPQARLLIDQCDVFLLVLSNNSVLTIDDSETGETLPTAMGKAPNTDAASETHPQGQQQDPQPTVSNSARTCLTPAIQFELDHALGLHAKQSKKARARATTFRAAKPMVIPLLIYGDNVPNQLLGINYQDFRDLGRYQHEFDRLLTAISVRLPDPARKDLHYRIAVLDPHPAEVVRLQSHIFSVVERAIAPIKSSIEDIVNAQRQQSWIMSTEMIAVMEVQAKSEIWVVTTHLWNDVNDDKIRDSVKRNMQRGICYRYFVRDSALMRTRIEEYTALYGTSKPKTRNYKFIIIRDSNMLMPFDEVVIYDGLDDLKRWGYAEMTYKEHAVFIKLGERNVMTMFAQLEKLQAQRFKGNRK